MFSFEISFPEGPVEVLFVRRPQALVGASDAAHVVIDDMRALDYQLRIVRGAGREFRTIPVSSGKGENIPSFLEGVYDGEAHLVLGSVALKITALDLDLVMKEREAIDRAGARTMRIACSHDAPVFPALVIAGSPPAVVSFAPEAPVYIGRSKRCGVRLDAADVSAEHARVGFESGRFWIEDLGSTNGSFVRGQQISGRAELAPGESFLLARDIIITPVVNDAGLKAATATRQASGGRAEGGAGAVREKGGFAAADSHPGAHHAGDSPTASVRAYPVLLSMSDLVRPQRVLLKSGSSLTVGRDPSCDVWIGAPHVSRQHCRIELSKAGLLTVVDSSTNGTRYDGGIVRRGEELEVRGARVLDFGSEITVALCFSSNEEEEFLSTRGARDTFRAVSGADRGEPAGGSQSFKVEPAARTPIAPGHTSVRPGIQGLIDVYRSFGIVGRLVLFFIGLFFCASIFVFVAILLPTFL